MRALRHLRRLLAVCLAVGFVVVAAEAKEQVHEVASGHSLWGIAKRYGVSVEAIRDRNELGENDKIVPGQKLVIPDKRGETFIWRAGGWGLTAVRRFPRGTDRHPREEAAPLPPAPRISGTHPANDDGAPQPRITKRA